MQQQMNESTDAASYRAGPVRAAESHPQSGGAAPSRAAFVGLLLLCLFAFFWRLGSVPLFDLDEALYVTCAREMVLTGDMITPRLNSRPPGRPDATTTPFFEKPIMVYWAAAASMRLFGISELAARLPAALASLLTTLVIAWTGARWFSWRAGLLAAIVYATAPITIGDARQMTTDSLLVFWLTGALFTFRSVHRALRNSSAPGVHWDPPALPTAMLFWALCGAAVLTKGIVGLLLPALIITIFVVWEPGSFRLRPFAVWWPKVRRLRIVPGLILFLAIVTPWHLLIWRSAERDGNGRTWVQEYVIRQHVGRFKGIDKVHNAPLPSYFAYFLLGFFPWACFAPAAFRIGPGKPSFDAKKALLPADPARPPSDDDEPAETVLSGPQPWNEVETNHRFLLVWFWTIFIFFSLGAAKLPTYIAPAYPAAALLVGRWLDRALAATATAQSAMASSLRRGAFGVLTAASLLAVVAVVPFRTPRESPVPLEVVHAVRMLAGLLVVGSALGWACLLRGVSVAQWRKTGIATLVAMMLCMVVFVVTIGYRLAAEQVLLPYQSLAAAARTDTGTGIPVLFLNIVPRRPSMLYYARYSPFEEREAALMPPLREILSPTVNKVDVITTQKSYEGGVLPEVRRSGTLTARLLRHTGDPHAGWVLARIARSPHQRVTP